MSVFSARAVAALALGLATIGAGACTPLRSHQGYVLDVDLINSVQPGVDTRQSVLQTLGKPSFASQFNPGRSDDGGDWYYIARDAKNFAYNKPRVTTQTTLRITFDAKGVVTAIRRTGAEQVASINPSSKTTPTLGRERGFFDDLFGNIGTVGAIGGGQGGGDNGGRDTPLTALPLAAWPRPACS